jgi:xanthine/CO dehydrogenase XdhC/CoxF family maturation factor
MFYELIKIINAASRASEQNLKTVFVSVVALEGSSYRRPGVRMLIREDGYMVGAVSGGCVEKEITRQAESVFKTNTPKVFIYDGRYRLGCEGILHILIEPFELSTDFTSTFEAHKKSRKPITLETYYSKEEANNNTGGTRFVFGNNTRKNISTFVDEALFSKTEANVLLQTLSPQFRLFIIGSEHDAVQLCAFASLAGWDVQLVAPPEDPKTISNFPGASKFHSISADALQELEFDSETAVVLMTHSFVKDLTYLQALTNKNLNYIGLLGPSKRREQLISKLMEHTHVSYEFLDNLHGPCGLDIGAETAQEIAISIISEILSVFRNKEVMLLKNKVGTIHS